MRTKTPYNQTNIICLPSTVYTTKTQDTNSKKQRTQQTQQNILEYIQTAPTIHE